MNERLHDGGAHWAESINLHKTLEDVQLYLHQNTELEASELQRYELEGQEARYELQGLPLILLPVEDRMSARQELRAAEQIMESDIPY